MILVNFNNVLVLQNTKICVHFNSLPLKQTNTHLINHFLRLGEILKISFHFLTSPTSPYGVTHNSIIKKKNFQSSFII
jgi:hypothetical protein